MHDHPASVAVLSTGQNARFTFPDGGAREEIEEAGAAIWDDALTHLPENLSDEPLEVVLIELKPAS